MSQHLLDLQQVTRPLQLPLLPLQHLHVCVEFSAISEGKLPKQVLVLLLYASQEQNAISFPFLQQLVIL